MLLIVAKVQFDNPPSVLKDLGFGLCENPLGFLKPSLGLQLGIFVELEQQKSRVHGFVLIIKKLVFVVGRHSLEKLHAKMIDVLDVLARLERLPKPTGTRRGILEDFFGFVHEGLVSHLNKSKKAIITLDQGSVATSEPLSSLLKALRLNRNNCMSLRGIMFPANSQSPLNSELSYAMIFSIAI